MICHGCGRGNDRARRYCGGCGANLPACTRCGFANDRDDRYCGGCGTTIETAAAVAPRRVTGSRPPVMPAGTAAGAFSHAELVELLSAEPAASVRALPDGSIGQDDLDRLFGDDA